EDDGRSQAYRRGSYALTTIECEQHDRDVTVRIHAPTGDRSVVPSGRRYVLRVRIDRVERIHVDGTDLPRLADAGGATPGWGDDGHGFAWVRLPHQPESRPGRWPVVTTIRT